MQLARIKNVFNDSFNLVLVCKDIEPRNGRTRTRGYFRTFTVVSLTRYMLYLNFLKHSFIKSLRLLFVKKIYHELWFTYCNTCNLIFLSLKLENGLKKHVRNVARMKHGFVELFVILFALNTRCDYVIPYFTYTTTT